MTKIEEILEKYKTKTDYYADQEWYDEDIEKALKESLKINDEIGKEEKEREEKAKDKEGKGKYPDLEEKKNDK